MKKRLLSIIVCFHAITAYGMTSFLQGRSVLSPRSQSVNAARELVGWYRFINLYGKDCVYGAATATPSGGHSFRSSRIAQYFFNTNELVIAGSQVANRQPYQILADYFGLSPLYQSTVFITPKISMFLVDFDAYVGYESFYIRAHAPAVWTRYSMELQETAVNTGTSTPFPALYMASSAITAPAQSWTQAMTGGITYGEVTQGINFGRIIPSQSTAALSEIQVALGYNFINTPCRHVGFNIRGSIPTGTRIESKLLFQPIVGNGHHGELGIGFTGHNIIWEKDACQNLGIYIDINATHLFNTTQCRSFDLCPNGFGSRYTLVKEFNTSNNYIQQTVPLINLTTLRCKVKAALQLDLVVMFGYLHGPWSVDLGYNAWLRTHEQVTLLEDFPESNLGLKGIKNFETLARPSNATQSTATLFGNPFTDQASVADPAPPIFITLQNINLQSGEAPRAFTNKIFGHVSYVFDNGRYVDPFIGAGGEAEFEGLNPRNGTDSNNNSVSQWALWIKGGVGF